MQILLVFSDPFLFAFRPLLITQGPGSGPKALVRNRHRPLRGDAGDRMQIVLVFSVSLLSAPRPLLSPIPLMSDYTCQVLHTLWFCGGGTDTSVSKTCFFSTPFPFVGDPAIFGNKRHRQQNEEKTSRHHDGV